MSVSRFRRLWEAILRRDLYSQIPFEDLLSRQRFVVFRIYSLTSFIVGIYAATFIYYSNEAGSFVAPLVYALSFVLALNYLVVRRTEQLPVAYSVSLLVGILVLHLQAYKAGGVVNTGTMYTCVSIMTGFMLLGPRGGKFVTLLALANVVFLYFASEYTQWTSYELFQNDIHQIRMDALSTFVLALLLVAAQSNYLHSSKNVIIERITEQKDELEISNRKLQEYTHNLERTNKELDKFASIVSHDLKAPLRAIGNLTGWIEEDAGDSLSPEVRANFDMIKQRVRRMEDLINAILEYSRADRRKGEEVMVDTKALAEESMDFIGTPKNAVLEVISPMPVFVTDKTRLTQVFLNLLGNAVKYNDKPEIHIQISARETRDAYEFSVKDNGPGIEAQYHDKIFVIFQTLQRRDDVESTGVGLAIVKKIIEDQGGKIWVESEPGSGADFRFVWPKVKKSSDTAAAAA